MKRDTRAERAAKRRFALLTLLHLRPRQQSDIVAALEQANLFDEDRCTDPASTARQQHFQFRHDRHALRLMGCEIAYDRSSKYYTWRNSPFGLRLDQAQLSTLAMMLDTFTDSTILHANDIRALLNYLVSLLPADQQKALDTGRRPFSIDLHETTDYQLADPGTIKEIELAILRGQQVEFIHKAPRDGKERRHVIEPRPLVFERGHVYLSGWSIDWNKELRFRLDYIVPGSAQVLHPTISPSRPRTVTKLLRYHLSPIIARNKVSEHFPGQVVETHTDGSATVTAHITDLFDARRILLSYGLHCVVLEPPELVKEMRTIATELYKIYCTQSE
jgi:predicted DNA-binding transcriptional regulator YafY